MPTPTDRPRMRPRSSTKGKSRAVPPSPSLSPLSRSASPDLAPSPEPVARPAKRAKRAETRECPICAEHIPLRLLAQHAELEASRVDAVLAHVGDIDVWADPHAGHTELHTSSRRRTAALPSSSSSAAAKSRTSTLVDKTIRDVRRRRRARHILLRDATRDEDEQPPAHARDSLTTCPVCGQAIPGDPDVVSAHVDACLAHAAMAHESPTRSDGGEDGDGGDVDVDVEGEGDDPWEEITAADGTSRLRMRARGPGARRLGFEVRDRTAGDVEVDVDIDGEDDVAFGAAQFTEEDVVVVVDDGEGEEDTEAAVARARQAGDWKALAVALESQVRVLQSAGAPPSSVSCRVCLDPYVEATVSTGCWHALCRACWLRCLGSTKVCPICKRITAASDLRRVFL